jgi:hypothetical protein
LIGDGQAVPDPGQEPEVKGAKATAGIRWSPAQVSLYSSLFQLWKAERGDSHVHAVLGGMIAQHQHILGIKTKKLDPVPGEIVPVIAIEADPSKTALAHLQAVQGHLLAAGVGWPKP